MTPTAADIVSSPAWQEMQERYSVELFRMFQRTESTDTNKLVEIKQRWNVMLDVIGELEMMAREQ